MENQYDPSKPTKYKLKNFTIKYYFEFEEVFNTVAISDDLYELICDEEIILPNKDSVHYNKNELTNESHEDNSIFFKFLKHFANKYNKNDPKDTKYTVFYKYTYINHNNVNEYMNHLYIQKGNIIKPD
jgi:hypothetical protein